MRLCEEGWRGGWLAVGWECSGGVKVMLWRKGGKIDDSPVCTVRVKIESDSSDSRQAVSSKVSLWVEVGGLLRNQEQRIISVCGW